MSLKEQLAEYRAAWYQRVPAERQAIMQRHIDELRSGAIAGTMLKVGDRAPAIVLKNATGATVDVSTLLKKGPVIVTFYRGGWCLCNLELKAYQQILPEIAAAGASLVAISPEKPDETVSTAEKNALTFEVLSDVGQRSDAHSAWSTNSPRNSRAPTTGSIWISRPATARRANGRCRYQRPTSSTAMGSSSMRTRMSTIATARIPVTSCKFLRKSLSRHEQDRPHPRRKINVGRIG